jgi:hypothetical protein
MSLRSSALKTANILRSLASKPAIDIYTTSVTVRRRTWTGGRIGAEGGKSDDDLVLTPRPRVRELNQREITGSGGRYTAGDVKVGPLTPAHDANPGVGYTEAQLAPIAPTSGVEILYVLEGGITGHYSRLDLQTDRAFSYWLILRRKRATP